MQLYICRRATDGLLNINLLCFYFLFGSCRTLVDLKYDPCMTSRTSPGVCKCTSTTAFAPAVVLLLFTSELHFFTDFPLYWVLTTILAINSTALSLARDIRVSVPEGSVQIRCCSMSQCLQCLGCCDFSPHSTQVLLTSATLQVW